ncbi:hypothetical protein AB0B88_29250 [Micromonospora haikouensis]|uniref:hypothetical protein n=1 Tax=Micromonospora haikouensis TaxID=686309 RepID=UPI0033D0B71D
MRVAELVLAYVRVLVWPSVLVIMAVMFRSRVHYLFDRLNKLDVFGASIEFAQSVGAAREALTAANAPVDESRVPDNGEDVPAARGGEPGVAEAARHALAGIPAWRWPPVPPSEAPDLIDVGTLRQAQHALMTALDSFEQAFGPLTRGSASQMSERTGMRQWTAVMRVLDGADRASSLVSYLAATTGSTGLTPYRRELGGDYLKVISDALDLLAETLQATVERHREDGNRAGTYLGTAAAP